MCLSTARNTKTCPRLPIKWIFSMGYVLIKCFNESATISPISSVLNADHEYSVST